MSKRIFSIDIEKETIKNKHYRKVLYTDKYQQLVVMSLEPGEDLPLEVHNGSQFIRVESGRGYVKQYNGKQTYKTLLKDGISIDIPPNVKHYITNTSKTEPLKMYSVYSPPEHKPKTVNKRQPLPMNDHH